MTNYPFDYDLYESLEPFEEPEPPRPAPSSRRGGKRLAPKEPPRQSERRSRRESSSRQASEYSRPSENRSHQSENRRSRDDYTHHPEDHIYQPERRSRQQMESHSRRSEDSYRQAASRTRASDEYRQSEDRPRQKRPRRKKSIWGRIILILFCALLGAGLGFLAFLMETGVFSFSSFLGAPSGTAVDQTCLTVDTLEPSAFVSNLSENTQVSFASQPDFTTPGEQTVELVLSGRFGQKTTLTATLTVVEDTTPPVIEGVTNQSVILGEKVAYKQGVTVTDDYDQEVKLEVDSSQVDPTRAGSYTVTYRATDRSGNTAEATALFSFTQPSEYAEMAAEKAEAILSQITAGIEVTDGSEYKIAVAQAIYDWCRNNIAYSGHAEKGDWQRAAYEGFTKRSGDCYTYFAVSKAMFEVAGIPNIDVEKIYKEGRPMHYWSLIDCGTGWYHFDATPRVGPGDDFFMVTDAFLEAYSVSHDNSHEFDHSLYPATPAA